MKTTISMLTLLFSMLGTQSLFAQVADSVFFQIMNIPTKQGKVLLITENGKHYGMVDATDSIHVCPLKIVDGLYKFNN